MAKCALQAKCVIKAVERWVSGFCVDLECEWQSARQGWLLALQEVMANELLGGGRTLVEGTGVRFHTRFHTWWPDIWEGTLSHSLELLGVLLHDADLTNFAWLLFCLFGDKRDCCGVTEEGKMHHYLFPFPFHCLHDSCVCGLWG